MTFDYTVCGVAGLLVLVYLVVALLRPEQF